MWAIFYQRLKFPRILLFEILYIAIRHLVLVTFEHFIYIRNKGVCGKNLEEK
jgi:hypothetical protein